jgi:hypothetical protein
MTTNCPNLISSFMNVKKDEKNPNVYATEPHIYTHSIDGARYFVAGRPYPPKMAVPRANRQNTFDFKNDNEGGHMTWS